MMHLGGFHAMQAKKTDDYKLFLQRKGSILSMKERF
jgi:hypothetical protein